MADEDGEKYLDVVKGTVRPRRGKRKKSRGPWSVAEIKLSRQFKYFIASMHYMHPELADATAGDMTVLLSRAQAICERYKWTDVPDVDDSILHIVRDELDLFESVDDDDVDVYQDLT
jgi:hypothetical protein